MQREKVYHGEIVHKISRCFTLIKRNLSLSKPKQKKLEEDFFKKTIILNVSEEENEPSSDLLNNIKINEEKIWVKIPSWAIYPAGNLSVLSCYLTAITYLIILHIQRLFNIVSYKKNGSIFNTFAWYFGAELEKDMELREILLKIHEQLRGDDFSVREINYYYKMEGVELLKKIGIINKKILELKETIVKMEEDEYLEAFYLYQEKVVHTKKLSKPALSLLQLILETGVTILGCFMEDYVQILEGALLHEECSIGEGAVILKDSEVPPGLVIPARTVVKGRPVEKMREQTRNDVLDQKERAHHYTQLFLRIKQHLPNAQGYLLTLPDFIKLLLKKEN